MLGVNEAARKSTVAVDAGGCVVVGGVGGVENMFKRSSPPHMVVVSPEHGTLQSDWVRARLEGLWVTVSQSNGHLSRKKKSISQTYSIPSDTTQKPCYHNTEKSRTLPNSTPANSKPPEMQKDMHDGMVIESTLVNEAVLKVREVVESLELVN